MGTILSVDDIRSTDRLIDCRFSLADAAAGRQQFDAGHLPGAMYADLETDLSGPIEPGRTGRHPLPSREAFAEFLGQLGLSATDRIVAYDDAAGPFAARFWWMVRWLGHDDVHVLDGGYQAWCASGRPVETSVPSITPTTFPLRPALVRQVSADEVNQADKLIDAREQTRFNGEQEPIDPVAGHIPGAQCLPFTGNLGPGQTLLAPAELRRRFTDMGITDADDVTCYCGSGVTAAHNVLALRHAGLPEPALYAGSWSEWITDPQRPVATGADS